MAPLREVFEDVSMHRLFVLPPLMIVLLCGFLAVQDDASRNLEVTNIRLGEDGKGQTRIVLDMSARPDFLVGPVSPAGLGEPQIVIQLAGGRFAMGTGRGNRSGTGVVERVRYASDRATLVLNQTALPTRTFILPPAGDINHFRLVIDLDPSTPQAFAADAQAFRAPLDQALAAKTAKAATPLSPVAGATQAKVRPLEGQQGAAVAASSAIVDLAAQQVAVPVPSLKPSSAQPILADLSPIMLPTRGTPPARRVKMRPLIVLDPGHGGRDSGAVGKLGTHEDAITLSYAKILKSTLERRGYDVLLTRSDDTLVPHEKRIGLAREMDADLFMSIHADSLEDPTIRGASVYTLSAKRSARLEDDIRRDGHFVLYDVEVSREDGVGDILLDLAQSATRQNSDRLASTLIDNMRGTMPLLKNPKRRGALLVLLSPDVPAVLVELAFLSNSRDEANLRSSAWRRSAVNALADGVDAYFDEAGIEARLAGGVSNSG